MTWTAIGVPIDSVGRSGGTELAPAALREHGLLASIGADDAGDLPLRIRGEERDPVIGVVGSADVLRVTTAVREAVRDVAAGGSRPLVLGGCCTVVPSALAGMRDAGAALGVAYDPDEAEDIAGLLAGELAALPVLGPPELRTAGPGAAAKRAAARLGGGGGRYWIHLDVDVLDERVMPATDYLMPGGLDWAELAALMGPLCASPALSGLSVACVNPEKDPDGAYTDRTCALLAGALAGHERA